MGAQLMDRIARDRLVVGAAAALSVGIPVILLWPQQPEIHEQPSLTATPLPTVSLVLTGAATTVPLFNAGRSPAPVAAEGTAPAGDVAPAPAAAPTLVGIALGRGGGIVLLKSASGETVQAAVGEEVDGWRLVSIARDHAVAEQGGRRADLTFDFANKAAADGAPPDGTSTPAAQPEIPLPPPPGRQPR